LSLAIEQDVHESLGSGTMQKHPGTAIAGGNPVTAPGRGHAMFLVEWCYSYRWI